MKKTYIFFVFVIVIFLTIAVITSSNIDFSRLLGSVSTSSTDPDMIVHAIDYGDGNSGDTVLIESHGSFLLMDVAGDNVNNTDMVCKDYGCPTNDATPIIKYLKKVGVKKLSIYISHYHHDHYGLNNILDIIDYKENGTYYFTIENIYLPAVDELQTIYRNLTKDSDGSDICSKATSMDDASLKCRYKITLAKWLGLTINEESKSDKHMVEIAGITLKEDPPNYFDGWRHFLHYNLTGTTKGDWHDGDGIRPKNIENPAIYLSAKSGHNTITIGTSTLTVLYYNQQTNPLNYNIDYPNKWYSKETTSEINDTKIPSLENNLSLVSMITTKNGKKYFTAGDIQWEIEQELINKYKNNELNADLMKLSHHAESSSNFTDFVAIVKPQYAFYQHWRETSYKNIKNNKKLTDISYVGIRTACRERINDEFVTVIKQGETYSGNCDTHDGYMNIDRLGISKSNINSPAVSGTIRYVFTSSGVSRQCASSSCDSVDSVKVVYKKYANSTGTLSQTFEANYLEPYKFGYNYLGNYHNFLNNTSWTKPDPFGFGEWKWDGSISTSICNPSGLKSGTCALAYWVDDNGTKYRPYVSVANWWIKQNKGNVTMTAQWKPLYTYTLDSQGATSKGTTQIYGVKDADTISSSDTGIFLDSIETQMTPGKNLITKPTKKGSVFLGYNTKADGTGTMLIDDNGSITDNLTISNSSYQKDLTLYAIWLNESPECDAIDSTNIVSNTQVATISCNDDTKIVSYYFQKGDKTDSSTFTTISSPNKKFTKSFNITEAGTYYLYVKDEAGAISAKKTITYYGTTFNMKNGTVSPSYSKVITEKGREFQLPTPTANDGYKLAGKWYTNSSYTEGAINYGSSYTPSKSTTLYSQATNIPPVCEKLQYTNNVSSSQFVTVHCKDATKIVGYYFDKNKDNVEDSQFISVNKNIRFDKDIEVTNSGNYYFMVIDSDGARSSIKSIKFIKTTFNMDKGSVSPSTVLTKDGETFQLPKPTADKGYSAIGNWYNDKTYSSGTRAYESDYTPSANKSFFSKATANTYEVTFNGNGGTGSMSKITMTYDKEQQIPKNKYTRTGYKFIGWSKNKKDNPVEFTDEQIVSNLATSGIVTLYAQWTKMVEVPTCSAKEYTGSSQTLMSDGTGYTVSNNTGTNAGNYNVKLTLKDNYVWSDNSTGTKTVTCTINPYPISKTTITVKSKTYTGSVLTPTVTVKHGTKTLTKDTDYTVSFSDNIEVGTGHATITGKGNYTGTVTKNFTIYAPDDPNVFSIDSDDMELKDGIIYTLLPSGVESINKGEFWDNITKSNTWHTYIGKGNNRIEITDDSAMIKTGMYIGFGATTYDIAILGDINQDGRVTVADLYQSYLLFKNRAGSLTDIQKAAANYDKNNKHDLTDLYHIYKKMKEK